MSRYPYYTRPQPENYPLRKKFRDLVYDTPIEIAIGALLVGSMGGYWVYQHNNEKMGHTPIAFSEIESTLQAAKEKGAEVGGLTTTLSYTSDVTMKVIESRNLAWVRAGGEDHKYFAQELETRVNPALKKHALISEYAAQMPGEVARAMQSLAPISEAAKDAAPVAAHFGRAWNESHKDHYRTEVYVVTVCTSNGKTTTCSPQVRTRQVYVNTTHSYTYNSEYGAAAAQALGKYLAENPDITVRERLIPAKETHRENEEAMAEGLRAKFKDKLPTKAEILDYANTWVKGSNFTIYLPQVYSGHSTLEKSFAAWNDARTSAQSVSYKTTSRTDSGPREFQVARRAEAAALQVQGAANKITNGIEAAGVLVPKLNAEIVDYVAAVKADRKSSELDARRERIMDTAMSAYKQNFENGFDLNPFKWGMVILVTVLSTLFGSALGTGVDHYINTRKRRGFFMDDKPEPSPDALKHKKTLRDLFGRKSPTATETVTKPKFDAPQL